MSVLETSRVSVLDDTTPLYCIIQGSENVQSHTEFIVRVQRGELKENSWVIRKRYSDFATLVETLKISGMDLPLPPKKLIGNMEREFIAERQRGLQRLLETILANPMLAASEIVKKFLDANSYTTNIPEAALQNVSMFFRSEPHWEVVEPLKEMGWRLRKTYFLIKPKDQPKRRLLLSWTVHGPDRLLSEKDITGIFKLLPNLQHPSISSTQHAMTNETGGLTIKQFYMNGTLRDHLCKTKPMKAHYLKKYCAPKAVSQLSVAQTRQFCRQILEMLKFLHEKGLACHHLHTGNLVIEDKVIKLLDIENYLLGVPPFYKPFYTQFRKINSAESIDVYSFGHVLYEMVFGRPLNKPTIEELPPELPAEIRSVLESILTVEACKLGLPTLEGLLMHPLFVDEVVVTVGIKPQLKIPSKLKETLRQYKDNQQKKLKEEQKVISQNRRLSKAKAHHSSDEERRRRKLEARRKSAKKLEGVKEETPSPTTNGGNEESSAASEQSSASPAPPAPPPPPTVPSLDENDEDEDDSPPLSNPSSDRGALLSSIQGFKKASLKKSQD
ncbi:PX domain-containing protein kinase-like protein isoform X1 [Styela clava]